MNSKKTLKARKIRYLRIGECVHAALGNLLLTDPRERTRRYGDGERFKLAEVPAFKRLRARE
jgi:hypothetical protein